MTRLSPPAALLALLLSACNKPPAPSAPSAPVTVYAASSLKEVVTQIAEDWSKRTGRPTRLQFDASSTLSRQIQDGAAADLFIPAAPEWLQPLRAIERFDWLSNRLVVVVKKDTGEIDLHTLSSLALADEQVPAGKYGRAALEHEGVKLPERTIPASNVRDVLSQVLRGEAQAGIVYATDAVTAADLRIAFVFQRESHPRIVYPVGLLTPAGRELSEALKEPAARKIARYYGFSEAR